MGAAEHQPDGDLAGVATGEAGLRLVQVEPEDADDEIPADSEFLAFLEYLGSWEESDEEWRQFHPDEGLAGAMADPAPDEDDRVREVEWDDDGRS